MKIEDVGEKFGGARKDEAEYYASEASISDEELAGLWPKPNFKRLMLDKKLAPQKGSYYQALYKNLAKHPPTIDFESVRRHQWPELWRAGILWLRASFENKNLFFEPVKLEENYKSYMRSLGPKSKDGQSLAPAACGKATSRRVTTPFYFRGQNKALALYLWRFGYPFNEYITEKDGFCLAELFSHDDKLFEKPFWCIMEAKGVTEYYSDDRTHYPTKDLALCALNKYVDEIKIKRAHKAKTLIKKPKTKTKKAPVYPFSKRPSPPTTNTRVGPPNPKRNGNCTPQNLIDGIGFRGVEFGNWVTNEERQNLINETFDAAYDLCTIVRAPANFASLWGRLGVAYGSRGRGGSMAHYNVDKSLIHINRYPGIGSYAHEMAHAIDYFLIEHYNLETKQPLSELPLTNLKAINSEFAKLMDVIVYDSPRFIQAAHSDDFRRAGQYWASNRELFARAFECYVNDILKTNKRKNDFLVYG